MVRDRGLISSIEFRLPVLFDKSGAGMLQLAPFFDFGGGWNYDDSPSPKTICSTGVGLLFTPGRHLSAEIYWGYRLRDVDIPTTQACKGMEWVSRSTCRRFSPFLPVHTYRSDPSTAPENRNARHLAKAYRAHSRNDAAVIYAAGYDLLAGRNGKSRCTFKPAWRSRSARDSCRALSRGSASIRSERLDSASYQIPASAYTAGSDAGLAEATLFLSSVEGSTRLITPLATRSLDRFLGIGDQSHNPLVLHAGGELHAVLRQPQTLDACASASVRL